MTDEGPATIALNAQIVALREQDQAPPCAGRDEWISEQPDDRARAANACLPCPILAFCLMAAEERKEPFGVWGGIDRAPGSGKRKKTA